MCFVFMSMKQESQYTWTDKDKVVDYTEPLKKLWDNLIPPQFPQIKTFETKGAKWVEHKKTLGGDLYYIWEEDLKYLVRITMKKELLIDSGWNGTDKVTQKLFNKVYGEDIFPNIRYKMLHFAKFVGLKLSQFDLEGDFKVFID